MAQAVGVQVSPSTPFFPLESRFYKGFGHIAYFNTINHNPPLVISMSLYFQGFFKSEILIKSFRNCLDTVWAQILICGLPNEVL